MLHGNFHKVYAHKQQIDQETDTGLPWCGSTVKNLPVVQETQETRIQSLGWEDPLEKGTATCSSILAWKIPRTEEPGGLHSMGSQRVRHD